MLSRTTTLLLAALMLPLSACSTDSSITTLPLEPGLPVAVGSDRDAHGCIGSAGFSWSEVLGECVQPFNVGKHLLPIEKPNDGSAVFATYVIFSKDGNRAEVSSIDKRLNGILTRAEGQKVWKRDGVVLSENAGLLEIRFDGQLLLREEVKAAE